MKHRISETHKHPRFPRLVVDLRSKSRFYQARTFLDGKLYQHSTKSESLTTALKLAEEWYRALLRSVEAESREHPVLSVNPNMTEVFRMYASSERLKTVAAHSYAKQKWSPIHHFWGPLLVRDVTTQSFHEFIAWRRKRDKVSTHTLHKDITLIRQLLKFSAESSVIGSIPYIPRLEKIRSNPRKWFDKSEWQTLLKVSRGRITAAEGNRRLKQQRQDNHDFMVFMVHSMMRVEEVQSLTVGDCRITRNSQGHDVLVCNVRKSKTGPRPSVVCLSGAATVYKNRSAGQSPVDLLFPRSTRDAFRELLNAANLRGDADGNRRNRKSLRATGIAFRVLEGSADIAMIAKNSGTGIGAINDFYAKHLRGTDAIDALTRVKSMDSSTTPTKKSSAKTPRDDG